MGPGAFKHSNVCALWYCVIRAFNLVSSVCLNVCECVNQRRKKKKKIKIQHSIMRLYFCIIHLLHRIESLVLYMYLLAVHRAVWCPSQSAFGTMCVLYVFKRSFASRN